MKQVKLELDILGTQILGKKILDNSQFNKDKAIFFFLLN